MLGIKNPKTLPTSLTSQEWVVVQIWSWVSSLRHDAKYPAYGPMGGDVLGKGKRQARARKAGPSQDRGVRDFKSVKLPTQVGNQKFKRF